MWSASEYLSVLMKRAMSRIPQQPSSILVTGRSWQLPNVVRSRGGLSSPGGYTAAGGWLGHKHPNHALTRYCVEPRVQERDPEFATRLPAASLTLRKSAFRLHLNGASRSMCTTTRGDYRENHK